MEKSWKIVEKLRIKIMKILSGKAKNAKVKILEKILKKENRKYYKISENKISENKKK